MPHNLKHRNASVHLGAVHRNNYMSLTSFLEDRRSTTWPVIGLAFGVYCGSTLFINAVLYRGTVSDWLGSLYGATGYFLNGALVGGVVGMVLLGLVIFGVGRLRPADVGVDLVALGWGLLVTAVFWTVMQCVIGTIAAARGDWELHSTWTRPGALVLIGSIVGQFFGNALLEEIACRGFFLPQMHLKWSRRFPRNAALGLAVVASSLLFAVAHLPNRLFTHHMAGTDLLVDQIGLVVAGLIFATIFLVTKNLFIAVGLHTILNVESAALFRCSALTYYAAWFGLTVLLLVSWLLIRRAR